MTFTGLSLIGRLQGTSGGKAFHANNPATGQPLEPAFFSADPEEITRAVALAREAFDSYSVLDGKSRAAFLRRIADGIEANAAEITERANLETGLPVARFQNEIGRTCHQLRLFADVAEEGSWVHARIDHGDAARKPPVPDVRSMLRPLGPVVVFGASNFPLAFSTAGGDTASALAAGNPVIVKAHPAHPGTGELVARAIQTAVRDCGLHQGVFSFLLDAGTTVGADLVAHPDVKAVGFTGSLAAGRALMDIAAARPHPIPVFAEMGSTNPVFILPGALRERSEQIASGLYASITIGSGQFCTKPGLVFVSAGEAATSLAAAVAQRVREAAPFTMLTKGIQAHYADARERRNGRSDIELVAVAPMPSGAAFAAPAALYRSKAESLLADPHLTDEVFGPNTLLVEHSSREQVLAAARHLEGHLTATIHGTEQDLLEWAELIAILETKVGRLVFNGFPTGVEVNHAMVHGGPYPATSDGRSTSVGSAAIFRFARPVCYQDFPQSALPAELRDENELHIWRMVDGKMSNL